MIKKIFTVMALYCATAFAAEPRFDWSTVLNIPPGAHLNSGSQILHFKSLDKPYTQSPEATLFVETYLKEAKALPSDAEVLRFASDSVTLQGLYIDLGVCTGKTVNFIAALNPHQIIYGFDSFEGLPEPWTRKDRVFPTGSFGFKNPDALPPVLHNVLLFKGWFKDTLTQLPQQPIALLHIDSDLYSSAATALQILSDRIVSGTILIFDELYNYPGSADHEFKALQEFLSTHNLSAHYLAYNPLHEQVALRIVPIINPSMQR